MESGAEIEDTAESASRQAADDENGIFFRAAFQKDSPRLTAFCYGNKRRINGTNSIFIGKQEISLRGRNLPPLIYAALFPARYLRYHSLFVNGSLLPEQVTFTSPPFEETTIFPFSDSKFPSAVSEYIEVT